MRSGFLSGARMRAALYTSRNGVHFSPRVALAGRCWEDGGRGGSGWQNIWAYATNVCPRPRHRVIKRQSSFPIMPISLSVRLHEPSFPSPSILRELPLTASSMWQPFLGCLRREAEEDKLCCVNLHATRYVSHRMHLLF